jgi:hypothetical protein
MRSKKAVYIIVIVTVAFPGIGLSLESPGASNPLGLGTVPPTAYKSGLIPSINPINTSGNLVITGNVVGGMQFRGVVPYNSETAFYAPAGSLSSTSGGLDSFLKRTEGSQAFRQGGSGLTPYYSPSWTVSKTIPGSRGTDASQIASTYRAESYAGLNLQGRQPGYRYAPQSPQRPLSMNTLDIEKTIEADTTKYPLGGEMTPESQSQEQFWKQLGVRITRNTEPTQTEVSQQLGGIEPNIGLYLQSPPVKRAGVYSQATTKEQHREPGIAGLEGARRLDVYEQIKIRLGEPATVEGQTEGAGQRTLLRPEGYAGQAEDRGQMIDDGGRIEPNATGIAKAAGAGGPTSGGAARILDTYESFAAYSDDKFNKNMRAAEHYMKQGRFYRAADAYTIATVYKPDDPLGYAGKSIALFATGEYMSSALFLARAVEIFPEYTKVRVDIVGMIGDKDTVENRIAEAREWLDRSESGELAFLLSYVFYQMDRLEFARQTIEFAVKQLPDSQVVAAMKKAIDERLSNQ